MRLPEDAVDADIGVTDDVDRRSFLRVMGASLALAGVGGCDRRIHEEILPYSSTPTDVIPGRPSYYATSVLRDGCAIGLLATCREGRPIKLEGNPSHPASHGAAGRFEQAAILTLYDPDRSSAIRGDGLPRTRRDLINTFGPASRAHDPTGARLHLLLEPTSSPLIAAGLGRLRARYPEIQVTFDRPFDARARWEGARGAFGAVVETVCDLSRADVVVAFGGDPLDQGPWALTHARAFADRRRVRSTTDTMNRLYVAETAMSVTGSIADHRLRARPSEVAAIARAVLEALIPLASTELRSALAPTLARLGPPMLRDAQRLWVSRLVTDLRVAGGASVFLVGDEQPAVVHTIAHALHTILGAPGRTVRHITSPILEAGEASHGIEHLAAGLRGDRVDTLLIFDANPVYTAPRDLGLSDAVRRVPRSLHLGLYEDETARACTWHVPALHPLEQWGDARAADGTRSFGQPLLRPLHDGVSIAELLFALDGNVDVDSRKILREHYALEIEANPRFLDDALSRGLLADDASPEMIVTLDPAGVARAVESLPSSTPEIEIHIAPDPRLGDGRLGNNAWLQELPDPITKLTWDNAALVSAATASRLALAAEDLVSIEVQGRAVSAPVLVAVGHADDSITLFAGYGREGAESVARDVGTSAYRLRPSALGIPTATITKTGSQHPLAITQREGGLEGRAILASATLAEYKAHPRFARPSGEPRRSLYFLPPTGENQWAMSVDLAVCTGCSACVIACQAENNVPTVGKINVRKGREMHWLRIDRYSVDSDDGPRVQHEPMLCQHCEAAPCEYVCPVGATTHSDDGLNQMTYNRCVGTRFCSNNCPYKVRRFNFFDYRRSEAPVVALGMNPDVTVRGRGVMEKCSYCVQRIRAAEIDARSALRPIAAGDVVTACQQSCPTRAIVFGSLTDPHAEVRALHDNERTFEVLGELGTRPRTRYLAHLSNPHDDGVPT